MVVCQGCLGHREESSVLTTVVTNTSSSRFTMAIFPVGRIIGVATLLLLPSLLFSQTPNTNPPNTTLHIGATNLNRPELIRDLELDFTRIYAPLSIAHLRQVIDRPRNAWDSVQGAYFRFARDGDVKIVAPVEGVRLPFERMPVAEFYAGVDQSNVQNLYFKTVYPGTPDTSRMHGAFSGVKVPGNGSGGGLLVASHPVYISRWAFRLGDPELYRRIGREDRSTFFRVSMAMRVDSVPRGIAGNPLVAYAVLYRRVPIDPAGCVCSIYQPFGDTLKIYLRDTAAAPDIDAPGAVWPRYREYGWTLDFARSTVIRRRDSSIFERESPEGKLSLLSSIPVAAPGPQFRAPHGRLAGTRVDTLVIDPRSLHGRHRVAIVTTDTLQEFQVPLQYATGRNAWMYGLTTITHGRPTPTRECFARCDSLNRVGFFGAGTIHSPDLAADSYENDFDIRIFSTGTVPLTFLRLRVNQEMYDLLRAGALDTMITAGVDSIYRSRDRILDSVLGRLAFDDEINHYKYRSHGYTSRRIRERMISHGDSARDLFHNPVANFAAVRILSEDLDSARIRTFGLLVRQDYSQIRGADDPVPIRYANPDSMSRYGTDRVYRHVRSIDGADTSWNSTIAVNTDSSYRQYTLLRQRLLGSFGNSRSPETVTQGGLVPTLARLVDVAKVKYRGIAPALPVYSTIQDMGWRVEVSSARDVGGAFSAWYLRPPTPEEVTVQVWLSLNCGVDGVLYSDTQWDGFTCGFFDNATGRVDLEYSPMQAHNRSGIEFSDDTIWTGIRSRYLAIRRVNRVLRRLDSAIYLGELGYNREQLTVLDPGYRIPGIPVIDSIRTEKASPSAGAPGVYLATGAYDPPEETYLEATLFRPSPRDSTATANGARYLLVTNRRTWPIDTGEYGARAEVVGAAPRGLGAVDVRRPVVWLTGFSGAFGDSLIVEKVLDPGWKRTVRSGESLTLDWLEPGWGEMYRMTRGSSFGRKK